jgi:hypothetical protein
MIAIIGLSSVPLRLTRLQAKHVDPLAHHFSIFR